MKKKTKGNEKLDEISPLKYKCYENILFVINFLFMPWKISKKFKIKNKIYDDLIIISIYFMMSAIGIFLYIIGIFGVCKIIKLICTFKFSQITYEFVIALFGLFFGSINVVSAKQLLNEKDTDKIYAFSAIMVSVFSCIISFIVLIKDISFKY